MSRAGSSGCAGPCGPVAAVRAQHHADPAARPGHRPGQPQLPISSTWWCSTGRASSSCTLIKLLVLGDNSLGDRADDPQVQRALRFGAADYSPIALNDDGVRSFVVTLPESATTPTRSSACSGRAERRAAGARPVNREMADLQELPLLVRAEDGSVLLDDGAAASARRATSARCWAARPRWPNTTARANQQVIGAPRC